MSLILYTWTFISYLGYKLAETWVLQIEEEQSRNNLKKASQNIDLQLHELFEHGSLLLSYFPTPFEPGSL